MRFQSSPGGEAGCDAVSGGVVPASPPFQSSPGGEAGCDELQLVVRRAEQVVSILTRR